MPYEAGHLKRNVAEKLVAIRTIFPEDTVIGNQAWLVATTNRGATFLKTADVEAEGWEDVPEATTP